MSTPRVAAIHDLSGFGRCSLTIVIPTLSAMGVQCCPLPTAYLSTHTGGFTGNTFLDLTGQIAPTAAHWRDCGVAFDAVYTGFMGSREQMSLTADFIESFRPCLAVTDPVMGDHGRTYRTYTPPMCRAMVRLAEQADVITPNRTEAAILLGEDYEALRLDTEADCRRWAEALGLEGRRSVVLTGAALSFLCLRELVYIREGTIITAIVTGKVMAVVKKPLSPLVEKVCFGGAPAEAGR